MKIQKKNWGGGGVGGRGRVWVGQGGCERRIEVFVKIKKKNLWGGGRGGGFGRGGGRVGGCERNQQAETTMSPTFSKLGA